MDVWNPRQSHNKGYDQDEPEGDDSWEVKAFEQDIKGNIAGTTWPPRSYTCSFCRREFRSAQALGGHMNVHRRDRATRLHGQPVARRVAAGSALNLPNLPSSSSSSSSSCVPTLPALIIQSTGNSIEGLCHLYQLHNPSGILGNYSADMNLCGATDTSSSPYSSALIPCVNPPYLSCNFTFSPLNSPVDVPRALDSSLHCYSAKAKNLASTDIGNTSFDDLNGQSKLKEIGMSEEPDLELRLGNKAAAPP